MASRLSRFLHLEQDRGKQPSTEEPSRLHQKGRFEAIEEMGATPVKESVPEAHLERFQPREAPLALAERSTEGPLFIRCARCETDNGRHAQECAMCGADLTTPEQRTFNEQFHQTRKEEAAREQQELAALLKQRQEAEAQGGYQALLTKRYAQENAQARWSNILHASSLGMGLLQLIPGTTGRGIALALAMLPPILLMAFGEKGVAVTGALLGLGVVSAFIPWSAWSTFKGRTWRR